MVVEQRLLTRVTAYPGESFADVVHPITDYVRAEWPLSCPFPENLAEVVSEYVKFMEIAGSDDASRIQWLIGNHEQDPGYSYWRSPGSHGQLAVLQEVAFSLRNEILRALKRFEEWRHILSDRFGFARHARPSELRVGSGDPHHGGRRPLILTVDCGAKLVYKPRSGKGDLLLNEVLHVAAEEIDLLVQSKAVYTRGNEGFEEYVPQGAPGEWSPRAIGQVQGLGVFLGLADLHAENIAFRADGEAVILDSEFILGAPPLQTDSDALNRLFALRHEDPTKQALAVGILPITQLRFGQDESHARLKNHGLWQTQEGAAAFLDGLDEMARVFAWGGGGRERISGAIKRYFNGDVVSRFRLRNTERYARALRDGGLNTATKLSVSAFLEDRTIPHAFMGEQVAREGEDLSRGDVPYFFQLPDEYVVRHEFGLAASTQRSKRDHFQYHQRSVEKRWHSIRAQAEELGYAGIDVNREEGTSRLIASMLPRVIAIAEDAIIELEVQGRLNYSFYDGVGGAFLFLSEYAPTMASEYFRELVKSFLEFIRPKLKARLQSRKLSGLGVDLYGLTRLECNLYARVSLESWWPLLRRELEAWRATVHNSDLIGGYSGLLCAAAFAMDKSVHRLELDHERLRCSLMELLRQCRERSSYGLVFPGVRGACTGLAHGLSGVALSLCNLQRQSGISYKDCVMEILNGEDMYFDPERQNWQSIIGESLNFRNSWCHGASGMMVARERATDVYAIDRAKYPWCNVIPEISSPYTGSICCGPYGALEASLTSARLRSVVDSVNRSGLKFTSEGATNGLFQGVPGVAHVLLCHSKGRLSPLQLR